MKNLFTLLAIISITISILGQVPEKMSYQCVVRDASGILVTNHSVGVRISILQSTSSGAVVYQEIYNPNPQTNANGLLSLEIGGGLVITGTFSTINWASGPYFLKTETDPSGGTNYTIIGTTQLLSVPYSLFSKTAQTADYNSLTNKPNLSVYLTNETDPIFLASPAFSLTNGKITNWNTAYGWGNHSGLYRPIAWVPGWSDVKDKPTFASVATTGSYTDLSGKPTIDGSETKVSQGAYISITGTGTTGSPYVVNLKAHFIGEIYGGGVVFYVYDNGQHGLVAATEDQVDPQDPDQGKNVVWTTVAYQSISANAVRDGIGGGMINTERIILQAGAGTYAAQLCANYKGGDFADWYLPSKFELNLLYLQRNIVGGFAGGFYWCSNDSGSGVYGQYFVTGLKVYPGKSSTLQVRAIRAF